MNKLYKILIIPLLIVMVFAFGMSAFAELHTKWVAGDQIYFDSANIWAFRDDTDGVKLYDDLNLTFGTDNDATIKYDEDSTDKLILTCSDGFTIAGAMGITGNILMATTSQLQFHDTTINIYAADDGDLVINADATLIVTCPISSIVATTSMTVTSPSFKHARDASNYVEQTVGASGAVKVDVTGNAGGAYEIETDDGTIVLDAYTYVHLDIATTNEYIFGPDNVDMNSNNFTEVGTYAGTGAITIDAAAGGTYLDFVLETTWVSGTLINVDYASSTTLSDHTVGMMVDLTNGTVLTTKNVTAHEIKLPALAQSGSGTTVIIGINLSAAGTLAQTAAAGIITWKGINIQLPTTSEAVGTTTATAIYVTSGTLTSGTQNVMYASGTFTYGIDFSAATCATADIILQYSATIMNTSTHLLTITEPTITLACSTAINLDGPVATSKKLTITPDAAGTFFDINLLDEWLGGTLIDVDFGEATVPTQAVIGFDLDLGANFSATAEENVKGIDINLPTMTMDDSSNTVKGIEITTTGAFTLGASGGTAVWTGVDVTMPATTQTAGTVTATGLKVTAGAITTGTQKGLHLVGTYTIALDIDDGTDASSLTAASVVIDGGVAIVKQLYLGDDIDMGTSGSGVYDITLLNTNDDALSITDGTGDFMVFKGTATRSVTITPALIVTGTIQTDDTTDASVIGTAALVSDGGISCADELWLGDDIDMTSSADGEYDITLKTNVSDALSITDGTDIIVFETTTGTPTIVITPITTITGALTLSGGLVVVDDQTVAFGTGSDVTMSWNNTRAALITTPAGFWVSPEGISDRFRLVWVAGQRGKPAANGDFTNAAEATRMIADPNFEVLGTGGGAISVAYYAEGGIALATDGTDDHGLVMLPHLTADVTPWTEVTWGSDMETRWECSIKTGPVITHCIIWAGLKETNTPVTATDDDSAFFRYEDSKNGGEWEAISAIADSDVETDTNILVAINSVYHLVIEIASNRTAKFYINGTLHYTSAALTNTQDYIPYIGIEEDGTGGAARTLYVRGQAISRKFE